MHKSNRTFVHIVTHNHAKYISSCIKSLLELDGFIPGDNLKILVSDNNSQDDTLSELGKFSDSQINIEKNSENFGFCLSHNLGLRKFLDLHFDYYLCLNPDLILERDALIKLVKAIELKPEIGTACPKLLRADESLKALQPLTLDAAGMYLNTSLRHFDRGSGELDNGQFSESCYVFGGSGACLLMKRDFVEKASISQPSFDSVLTQVYPQYIKANANRVPLFDEAFFAYREDADLAWRSQSLGWKCIYAADAIGYHVRKVTPERRANLPAAINLLGVQNRFLLQLNNYSLAYGISAFVQGYLIRNLVVILGVLLKERSSFAALINFLKFIPRGLARRRIVKSRGSVSNRKVSRWLFQQSEKIN